MVSPGPKESLNVIVSVVFSALTAGAAGFGAAVTVTFAVSAAVRPSALRTVMR